MTHENLMPINILCAAHNSNYFKIPYVFPWTIEMDAYNFNNSFPVIAHPPCAQWSRMHKFSKNDPYQKNLAVFCFEKIQQNGGILEHPAGSHLFKYLGIEKQVISVNQFWFGFPAQKKTYLYFNNCAPGATPLNFDAITKSVSSMHSISRSLTTLHFNQWLVDSVRNSFNRTSPDHK